MRIGISSEDCHAQCEEVQIKEKQTDMKKNRYVRPSLTIVRLHQQSSLMGLSGRSMYDAGDVGFIDNLINGRLGFGPGSNGFIDVGVGGRSGYGAGGSGFDDGSFSGGSGYGSGGSGF